MRNQCANRKWIASLGFSLALLALGSARADDTVFFTTVTAKKHSGAIRRGWVAAT